MVNNRYPTLLRLLAGFNDGKGQPMAHQWLSDTDKRKIKAARKALAQREAERATFGDPAVAKTLRKTIDKMAHSMLDACIAKRINPLSAPLPVLKRAHPAILSTLTALQTAPQHRDTLARAFAASSTASASTAQRLTSAALSLLTRCNRVTMTNNIVEIK